MRHPTLLFPLFLALVLPAAARAQHAERFVPFVGVAVGGGTLPEAFQGCAPEARLAAELRGGLARGAVALEGRLVATGDLATEDCAFAIDEVVYPDGIHTDGRYAHPRADSHLAGDVRVRLGGTRALPLALSAGAGRLSHAGVPYLLAAAGVRLGGRLRLAVDVERDWYRATRREVTREWKDYVPVRTLSVDERRQWLPGTGVRLGLELALR